MPRPEWRDPTKEVYWRRMLRQWRRSELTGRDFCAQNTLSEPSFGLFLPFSAGDGNLMSNQLMPGLPDYNRVRS